MTPRLSIENLTVTLPEGADRPFALNNVSLTLHPNEILCVVGESGSGKSVTANAVLGLLPSALTSSGGRILFDDVDLLGLSEAALRKFRGARIGMVFQEPMTALNPLHKIGDQVGELFRLHTQLKKRMVRERVLALLAEVGLPNPQGAYHAYPHELSGGQRQRAMIAMALALEPSVLIADEPTTALDVTTQARVLALIRSLQRKHGTSVLFITHDFGVVAEIADRVAVMRHGRVVEIGPANQVLYAPSHPYTRQLIDAVPGWSPQTLKKRSASGEPPTQTPLLVVDALSKTYRKGVIKRRARITHALRDVSLTLHKGETLGIVGESGSGKSTLARCVMQLLTADTGSISLDGIDLTSLSAAQRRANRPHMQMVFQDPHGSLNPRKKVGDLISQGPIIHGVPVQVAHAQTLELLNLVGLDAAAFDRYPHEFSGGQRQRIGLARALALKPRVLVADEPVSALDVSVQAQVLALLAQLRRTLDLSILFITHDLRVAAQVCDQIAVMKDGQIVEMGNTAELFSGPAHPYTKALLAAVPGADWNDARTQSLKRQARIAA